MNSKHIIKLVLWILLAAASVYIVFMGLLVGYTVVLDGAYNARLGIDLKGGMHAILTPDVEDASTLTVEDIDAAVEGIGLRLDGQGIYDRSVMADYENQRIIVEIPWATGEVDFNPQKITEEIGDIAELTFAAVEQDSNGDYVKTGEDLVSGSNVTDAVAGIDQENGGYLIQLQFDAKGTEDFKNATTALYRPGDDKEPLGIFIDDVLISSPNVNVIISNGQATITGDFTLEEARSLANKIKSGSLPFKMVISEGELRTITPILGENALNVMIQAGMVALILILIFLLLYYRLPGLVSCLGLITQITLLILLMVWFEVSLTLPGIAGIILTFGMGIDANIIIFERMKEEISKGKNVASTIRDGFKNAFSAIADGNITVIITALVLYYFGTGSIKGFAVTFMIGIVLSFLTAFWMSRSMLLSAERIKGLGKPWLYGAKKKKAEKEGQQ